MGDRLCLYLHQFLGFLDTARKGIPLLRLIIEIDISCDPLICMGVSASHLCFKCDFYPYFKDSETPSITAPLVVDKQVPLGMCFDPVRGTSFFCLEGSHTLFSIKYTPRQALL